jgi:anaerobic dimethyl sulfoxide reductase subunit A
MWTDAAYKAIHGHSEFGDGQVEALPHGMKMMVEIAGNAILSQHMDSNFARQMISDRRGIEFYYNMDNFMTPSARYADLVLPGTTNWEQEDMYGPWMIGDMQYFTNKAVEPPGEAKTIYEHACMLEEKLGLKGEVTQNKTAEEWLREFWSWSGEPISYEEFKQKGVYVFNVGKPKMAGSPEFRGRGGIDPNDKTYKFKFLTPSGYVEAYSQAMVYEYENRGKAWGGPGQNNVDDDGDPIVYPICMFFPDYDSPWFPEIAEKYPITVINVHPHARIHSTHANNPYLREMYKVAPDGSGRPAFDAPTYGVDPIKELGSDGAQYGLEPFFINPKDARERDIEEGDKLLVWNDRGKIYAGARIVNWMQPGVALLFEGSWYDPDPVTGIDRGGNGNTLSSRRPTRIAHGNGHGSFMVQFAKA